MDATPPPRKRRGLPASLLRHLLAWALGALLLVWGVFVAVGWRTGVHEADELTDGHLASVAALMLAQRQFDFQHAPSAAAISGNAELRAHDYQQSLSIVVWDGAGKVVARTGEAPTPRFSIAQGFETLKIGNPPAEWRAFSRWDSPAHERKVTVLLSIAERDDLADDIAEQIATPGLWLLPVVALVLALAIRRGLRPLDQLSQQVHQLDIQNDTVLHAPPHEEFRAVVSSINTLMARYNAALSRERELASEVAHELRTPLASLSLHASSLQRGLDAAEQADAIARIERDAARAASVLSDLLTMARASRTELAEAAQLLDLTELARGVVADYGQSALQSGHELSLDAPEAAPLKGHPVLLELALRNLIDNAIAHTPRGTAVRVRVTAAPPGFEVDDNGRAVTQAAGGAPAGGNAGLGLGHQVVRRVAAVHGGAFEADDGPARDGGRYRLLLGAG